MSATEIALLKLTDSLAKGLLALGQRSEDFFDLQSVTIKSLCAYCDRLEQIAAMRSKLGQLDERREAELTAELGRMESEFIVEFAKLRRNLLDSLARVESDSDVIRAHFEQIKEAQKEPFDGS